MPRKTSPGTKRPSKKQRKPMPPRAARHEISTTEEGEASVKVARAWLADAGFHEDPAGEIPDRIEIIGRGYDGVSSAHYVNVRLYVPQIDIETQVDEDRAGQA